MAGDDRQGDGGVPAEQSGDGNGGGRPADEGANDAGGADSDDIAASRPIGFAGDQPVIRRIGNRELYLGNALAADDEAHDRQFDQVVSATVDPQPLTTHHRPLDDGPDNDWTTFASAVEATRRCYRSPGTTLVHCRAGVSRSATLVATAVAAEEGIGFDAALAAVRERRPIATPHPALRTDAAIYLAAEG